MIRVIDGTSAYGSVRACTKKPAAADLLLERVIDRQRGPRDDVLVVDVGRDPDDAPAGRADVDELHHRIGPHQPAVQRVLVREHPLRQALADDDDRVGVVAIAVVEIAARDDRHAQRGEEPRRDGAEAAARILLAVSLRVALDGELEARDQIRRRRATARSSRSRPAPRRAARRCAAAPPCRSASPPAGRARRR